MGADKPFAPLHGRTLIDVVIARVRPQVDSLWLNVRPEHEAVCRARYDFELVADAFGGEAGPLGGVVAGLEKLPAAQWLATFPCDTPFLPRDLVSTLRAAAVADQPAVAVDSGRVQNLCALWPPACLDKLRDGVASGTLRSAWRALEVLDAVRVDVDAAPHAFFNVNTPDDLAEAERIACEPD